MYFNKVSQGEMAVLLLFNFLGTFNRQESLSQIAAYAQRFPKSIVAELAVSYIGRFLGASASAYELQFPDLPPETNSIIDPVVYSVNIFSGEDTLAGAWNLPTLVSSVNETCSAYSSSTREVFQELGIESRYADVQKIHDFPALAVIAGTAAFESLDKIPQIRGKFGVSAENPNGIVRTHLCGDGRVLFVPNLLYHTRSNTAALVQPIWTGEKRVRTSYALELTPGVFEAQNRCVVAQTSLVQGAVEVRHKIVSSNTNLIARALEAGIIRVRDDPSPGPDQAP